MVLTQELADRCEVAAAEWNRAWMDGVDGIRLGAFAAHVLAPCHPDRPDLDFQNRVNGLSAADAALVPAITSWYAGLGVRPWFEVVPNDDAGELLAALAGAGAEAVGFHGVVLGPLDGTPPPAAGASDVDVRLVDDDGTFATFARTRVAGHDLPPEIVERAVADLGGWRAAPGVRLYLATVDGEPAATAALTIAPDGVAYLADGATVPAFRGRGLQSLLIRRRLHDAAAEDCGIACSSAAFASTSHRNLQRAGLTAGYTKVVLRVREGR